MKEYWEAHVTFYSDVPIEYPTWSFSKIDGDPVLGKGIKSYLTKHYKISTTLETIQKEFTKVTCFLFFEKKIKWIRKKIERVVYDSRIMIGYDH